MLTEQEVKVYDLIVYEGLDNARLAGRLGVSVRTAKFHSSNVLRKLGCPSRLELAIQHWKKLYEDTQRRRPVREPRPRARRVRNG